MDSRAREIVRQGNALFDRKSSVDTLWQEIALQFYPKRATFTSQRDDGEEYADHLFSSYPSMARRELGNMLAEFIRPDNFFSIHVDDEDLDDGEEERAFLELLTTIQRRAMADPMANLVIAANEADHDYVTFGNSVEWFGLNLAGDGLLFKCYHLRDNAWSENAEGRIDANHRNWNPTARQLKHHFPGKVSKEVEKACEKEPEKAFKCRHVVLPSRIYDYKSKMGKKFPFTSLYVECESETVLEEVGLTYFPYNIARWQRLTESPFGTSMATDVLIPDGRTLQVIMRTLREAGEMHVNPPMVAISDMIRGDISYYPGGITTADIEYDSKIGDVLRTIDRDKGGFPIGLDLATALKEDIRQGFFLDKIQLPETTRAMTATEVRRRIQEHIRASAPLAKPIQKERNNPLCDGVFQLLREHGVFPFDAMPETLADKEIKFKFRSPLDQLAEENEAQGFIAGLTEVLLPATQFDPSLRTLPNMEAATRDSLKAYGWKAKWLNPKDVLDQARAEEAQKQQMAEVMQGIGEGGAVAEQAGRGIDALVNAGVPKNGAAGAPAARPQR